MDKNVSHSVLSTPLRTKSLDRLRVTSPQSRLGFVAAA